MYIILGDTMNKHVHLKDNQWRLILGNPTFLCVNSEIL